MVATSRKSRPRRTPLDNQQMESYSKLLFTLQNEPQHLVDLLYLIQPPALDRLVLTIMSSIYGSSQLEQRDEMDFEDRAPNSHLLSLIRIVLSRDLDVSGDGREARWTSVVAGRVLGAYARREACQTYVEAVLGDYVSRIVEHEALNVEIDPLKVYEQIVEQMRAMNEGLSLNIETDVDPMEAAKDPGVQAIIKQRVMVLTEIATNILNSIITTPGCELLPADIRELCGIIKDVCMEKYPKLPDDVVCDLLGEFVFDRLIIPALRRPRAHGLVSVGPAKNPLRTFGLVSAMLQSVFRHHTSSDDTDAHMATIVSTFHEAHSSRVRSFLLRIADAHELNIVREASSFAVPSPISMRMDALYHLHALLVDYSDNSSAIDGSLSEVLAKCGPRPSQAQLNSKDGRLVQFSYSSA